MSLRHWSYLCASQFLLVLFGVGYYTTGHDDLRYLPDWVRYLVPLEGGIVGGTLYLWIWDYRLRKKLEKIGFHKKAIFYRDAQAAISSLDYLIKSGRPTGQILDLLRTNMIGIHVWRDITEYHPSYGCVMVANPAWPISVLAGPLQGGWVYAGSLILLDFRPTHFCLPLTPHSTGVNYADIHNEIRL